MIPLPLTRRHVVDDGVTPDIVPSVGLVDAESRLANDYTDFTLVIECAGELGVGEDGRAVGDNRCRTLGEDDRVAGERNLVGAVVTRVVELLGVLCVVLTHGQDVAAGDGR